MRLHHLPCSSVQPLPTSVHSFSFRKGKYLDSSKVSIVCKLLLQPAPNVPDFSRLPKSWSGHPERPKPLPNFRPRNAENSGSTGRLFSARPVTISPSSRWANNLLEFKAHRTSLEKISSVLVRQPGHGPKIYKIVVCNTNLVSLSIPNRKVLESQK